VREESYVVRIYRRARGDGSAVVGVVEAASTGWQKPFRNLQQLTDILACGDERPTPRSPGDRNAGGKSKGDEKSRE
jgi:hypothetical protein